MKIKKPLKRASDMEAKHFFNLIIPENLDLESLLRDNNRSKLLHSYAFLCHTIMTAHIGNRKLKVNDYVPLYSRTLSKMLTSKEANRVIEDLIEWFVIERDEKYSVATDTTPGRCKGYRLTEKYREKPVRLLTLNNRPLWKKLQSLDDEKQCKQKLLLDSDPTFNFLHRQLQRLNLDLLSAYEQVLEEGDEHRDQLRWCRVKQMFNPVSEVKHNTNMPLLIPSTGSTNSESNLPFMNKKTQVKPIPVSSASNFPPPPIPLYPISLYPISLLPILPLPPSYVITFSVYMRLKRLDKFFSAGTGEVSWEFKVDPKTGRLFTNLTNLSRANRRHLYLKSGERLVVVDVGECQPFMFAMMLLEEAKERWGEFLPEDVLHYIELTSNRGFYRFIMEECKVPENGRDTFKKNIFGQIFYCSLWTLMQPTNKPGSAFRKHFPNVHDVLVKLKGSIKEELPLKLMNQESKIILHKVCKEIAIRGDNNFFIATIHDGIVTTECRAEEVKQQIIEAFRCLYGHAPTVKVEAFNYNEEVELRA